MLSASASTGSPRASAASDPASDARAARERLLWTALGALVALQVLALALLCAHQVRKAEARRAQAQVAQMAMNDCLQYVVDSTIASCATRMGQAPAPGTLPTPVNMAAAP